MELLGPFKLSLFLVEEERSRFLSEVGRKRRFALVLAVLLAVFVLGQIGANLLWNPLNLAQGRQFDDYDSFRRYMYEDHQPDAGLPESMNSVSDEIPERREIRIGDGTLDGKLVCVYAYRNYDVMTVKASDTEDGLPLMAITYEDYRVAQRKNGPDQRMLYRAVRFDMCDGRTGLSEEASEVNGDRTRPRSFSDRGLAFEVRGNQ